MDSNIFEGNWSILKGKVKENWGKLTDDDLQKIDGKKDQLIGRLQKQYGYSKEEAQKQIKDFESSHLDKN
ncbi:MAG: CsbD family protein [Waddliaceae bacterium]